MRNETSRDVTCDCTYEAVGIEDGLARPVLLAPGLISETGPTGERIPRTVEDA